MKRFVFDLESFRTFFLIHAKFSRKDFHHYAACAKRVMSAEFHRGMTPRFVLGKDDTKSGSPEPYIQFPKDVKESGDKVVKLSDYHR